MSRQISEHLVCPDCDHHQDIFVWSSINVTVDPPLREKLFTGATKQEQRLTPELQK